MVAAEILDLVLEFEAPAKLFEQSVVPLAMRRG